MVKSGNFFRSCNIVMLGGQCGYCCGGTICPQDWKHHPETHPYYLTLRMFSCHISKNMQVGVIRLNFTNSELAEIGNGRNVSAWCPGMDCATPSTITGSISGSGYGLPYLFKDKETAYRLRYELGSTFNSFLPKINLYNLGYFENGFRHVTNNRKPSLHTGG